MRERKELMKYDNKPNCFEKTKVRWPFLKNFLPQSYIRSSQPRLQLTVSIGGDSDTIAAITGSIAEAFYGIPINISVTALNYYLPDDMLAVIEKYNKKLIHNKLKQ